MNIPEEKKYIYKTPEALSVVLAEKVLNLVKDAIIEQRQFHIAISGGRTPKVLFDYIASAYQDPKHWNHTHFYWVDERCVPHDHPLSNYRLINEALLRYLTLPYANVHRMMGEKEPYDEAARYERDLQDTVPLKDGLPCFDLILLGIGEDGHTASIFPDQMKLFHSEKLCEVGIHPETRNLRITMTGKVINNAKHVYFLVTGKEKSVILAKLFNKNEREQYPAGLVSPTHGTLEWFLDDAAAKLIC